jgi:hypothetical protein
MKKLIFLIFLMLNFNALSAQNRLQSHQTWLVYENKGKDLVEQLIIKADEPELFYQSNHFKLTRMIKDTLKSTENEVFYSLEGQKGEYKFLPGQAIMISRPELSNKINWEVFEMFTRLNPDGSKSVFKLKRKL